ncbi:hypothetical protein PP568_06790 [Mycobacteroides abscessus]|uniref:Uncharacterized protein n=1 Tax=Mycobacteroides abscessus subsp. abscessus TaxID=1185650 RepID=A0AB38D388_9MYCO|nr:hypothetical protein [Mycobacteroides abscessus]MBE5419562.1 hypothetical protein [Mycobacteroides abscessus]MBE5455739.1 hypothetical protein [Mycobacteroides abscessus]MBN7463633.1 hypothetical protein [Mycobacteroides abscessus subsp. abscessus]MBN7555245.1 hypothetical protein [Mycobacteroides abscessus subsp. abscessus]MDM2404637.1 hypothetical protein [Mycobacteroides abscessus]
MTALLTAPATGRVDTPPPAPFPGFSAEVRDALLRRGDAYVAGDGTVMITMPREAGVGTGAFVEFHARHATVYTISAARGVQFERIEFPSERELRLLKSSDRWWAVRDVADAIPAAADVMVGVIW